MKPAHSFLVAQVRGGNRYQVDLPKRREKRVYPKAFNRAVVSSRSFFLSSAARGLNASITSGGRARSST